MTWILVGYFPKRRSRQSPPWGLPPPEWVLPLPDDVDAFSEPVEEICSVSRCVAGGPEGWRDDWQHANYYGMYNSPDEAWSLVPVSARTDFELFAYRLKLLEFNEGAEEPMEEWPDLTVEPLGPSFVRLGWDAVVGGQHHGFGCSPLSCNAGARIVEELARKNRYCLVSTEAAGTALARHFSLCQPEPGPYCVVEVWRAV